ncbi:MAG: DNA-binding response regulator [Bryobacterales bacterium]|jgi:two-component system KDP operon response regulator KdpE|nr:DNA-binding response regulator [Bryobacterales bacterium]
MSSGRILVADDEPQIRRVMRTTLIAEGYEVSDVRTGDEVLHQIREERFDLLLLDVNMPGMSGLEVCRDVRKTSEIAIIMLTVRDSERDKVAALDAGADDYVTKPFNTPELLARIRAALRRNPMSAEAGHQVISLEGVEINLATRRVRVRGQDVRLTPKEFDLLHYMVNNPNVPLPHGKLLQAVWGPDYGDQVEYLRVFVNQLRKKLEPQPSKPRYIITEPWVGYRFCLPTRDPQIP